MQKHNFKKSGLNYVKCFFFFANIASFSCRGRQTLLSDMQFIIMQLIIKEKALLVLLQTNEQACTFLDYRRHTDANGI